MGKVYSLLMRPIHRFNIENRAARVIAKEKPVPAPQHPSTKLQKQLVDKLNPDFMKTHYKKDSQLDEYLKNVFVQSKDPQDKPKEETVSSKPLPQNRSQPSLEDHNFYGQIPMIKGRCTLQQAVEFITKHHQNSVEYSVEKISKEYQLDKQVVENILYNFKIFQCVQKPNKDKLQLKKGETK